MIDGMAVRKNCRDVTFLPLICPTCQNVFAGSDLGIDHAGYFAWGCFRYFGLGGLPRRSPSVFAFALLQLRRAPRGCATRSPKGEAWWARQDSNLQPDRYERVAMDQLR
jgi:hypothetical protein